MKFLVSFVLVAVVAVSGGNIDLPPEMKEMLHELENTCKAESGVEEAVLEAARKFDFKDDANFKCFIKCMMTNMQVLGEEGELDHDVIEQSLPEAVKKMGAMDVVEKCRSTKGSDLCDTGFQLLKCFYENGKEMAGMFT